MNVALANLSTDLRRISYWIYNGNIELGMDFLSRVKKMYKIERSVGPFKDIWDEIEKVKSLEGGRVRAADRASTLASILLQESLKDIS